ncbi:hypothetical protein BC834DRAFT_914086 [Gloeopeniophorella convolvens]|nr:hypothetical protein BC834DRAFT_914086 [Gloeopeniophorella convolvens]
MPEEGSASRSRRRRSPRRRPRRASGMSRRVRVAVALFVEETRRRAACAGSRTCSPRRTSERSAARACCDSTAGARLAMREDGVYAVLLNVTLLCGMSCTVARDPRYLRFSVLAPGETTQCNLRVAGAKATRPGDF